jgi:hypothetical protein
VRAPIFAAALFACACSPHGAQCDLTETRTIAFSAPNAHDVVTARATGPDCEKAIGLYAIRDGEGNPIWAWAVPLKQKFGAVTDAKGVQLQAFLQRWTQPTITRTSAAPPWPRLAPGQTTLDRLTYEDIRARDLPMLCHFSGTAEEICIFWEPAAGAAGLLLERNYEESNR